MVRVGDRLQWDNDAHIHTSQMNIANTGVIEQIHPVGATHFDDSVEACALEEATTFTIKVDDGPARICLCANCEDLVFPDAADDGLDLLAELWDEETTALVGDLMD